MRTSDLSLTKVVRVPLCVHRSAFFPALVVLFVASAVLHGADPTTKSTNARGHGDRGPVGQFNLDIPTHDYDLILCRPTKNSVTLSVLAYADMEGRFGWGTQPGIYTAQTPRRQFKKDEPAEVLIDGLKADTRYYYQFQAGNEDSPQCTFHTARPPEGGFVFTMTADAHLDEHTSAEVYGRTLKNIRTDKPDFHLDLGNLFMTDKHTGRQEAVRQYLAQRYYLGQIAACAPVFLALGTHDGEAARYDDGSADCLAVWSNLIRKRYFPNPVPDDFYTGNATTGPHYGLPQDYYAWEWGDALFIVLDPFRYSLRQHGGDDGWSWSLGQAQYQWLEQTLHKSCAKFKFVCIHNLLSGDQASRGGVEIASGNEWGGRNADGSDGFKDHRPGWTEPVHQLLLRNHVTAVFKAHDNFYARQELDGILYLMVPQPSFAGTDRIRDLENYGYKHGTFLGNSGHVRVTVSADKVLVEYVKSSPESGVADACTINAR